LCELDVVLNVTSECNLGGIISDISQLEQGKLMVIEKVDR